VSGIAQTGRSPWIATPFVALASLLGVWGLSAIIELGGWLRTTGFLLVLVMLAVIAARMLSRSRVVPSLVGAVAAMVFLIPAFARNEDGERRIVPTPGAFADLAEAIRVGIDHAATTPAPVEAVPEFVGLVSATVIALFLIAEHLAVSWRAVASAGAVLILPWLPAVIFQYRVPTVTLLVALAAWLAAMALTRRGPSSERPPSIGAALTATTVALVAVVLVTPTALGGNGWGAIPRIQTPDTFDTATRLNLALDLRNSLTTDSQSTVMTYTVTGTRPDSFRLYALTDFDGTAWIRRDPDPSQRPATGGVLWPIEVENWSNRTRQRIDIRVQTLTERNLPLPVAPRTVTVDGDWFYDAELDEVFSQGASTQGLNFQVVTDLAYHDAQALQDAQTALNLGGADPSDPRYLTISPAVDLQRVQDLARSVTSASTTRYEQALALQQYLRNPSEFTYDVSVSPSGGDSISTFLDDRTGYCVQFASTMVIMARSLDIPARLAVGFLGGRSDGNGGYAIRGGDAHAWPELYFPGRGWVRFEPTPAVQTGSPPQWADPLSNQLPVPRDVLEGGQQAPPPVVPENPTGPVAPVTPPVGDAAVSVWWWLVLGALALALAVGWWVWRSGGVMARHARGGAEGAWDALHERLGDDLTWSPTLTPHEASHQLRSRMELYGYGLSAPAVEALTRLSNAVSDHRYAPAGTQEDGPELMACVDTVMVEVDQARAAETTDRPVRGGARSALQRGA